nr:peroxisomal membrane protein 4 isoform X2 [Loxodonta africana]
MRPGSSQCHYLKVTLSQLQGGRHLFKKPPSKLTVTHLPTQQVNRARPKGKCPLIGQIQTCGSKLPGADWGRAPRDRLQSLGSLPIFQTPRGMRVSHALVRPPGSVIGSLWIRKAATAYGRSNARRRPGRCGRCSPPGSRFVGAVRLGARLSGAVGAMGAPPQLQALLLAVNTLLRKRRYHAALAMVKGFRNGAVYGAKIRAPHALVMTFLFRSGRSTCT